MINLKDNNSFWGIKGVENKFPDTLKKGCATISKFEFDENKNVLYNLRSIRDSGGFMRMYTGKYVRLVVNGELMMSDTVMERKTNYDFIQNANGRVLIAGLGIGLILEAILDKSNVTEVVVIEKYQDVIDLVSPLYQHPKLKIICADIFEYEMPKCEKFDCIYFDIWADISTDNLEEMKKLHAKYRKNKLSKDSYMNSWMREHLKKEKIRERYW